MLVITGEHNIRAAQALARLKALQLEAIGLKRRGPSMLTIIKRETHLTARTAKAMVPKYIEWLHDNCIVDV